MPYNDHMCFATIKWYSQLSLNHRPNGRIIDLWCDKKRPTHFIVNINLDIYRKSFLMMTVYCYTVIYDNMKLDLLLTNFCIEIIFGFSSSLFEQLNFIKRPN